MFSVKSKIKSLEKKGYMVISPEEDVVLLTEKEYLDMCDNVKSITILRKHDKKITSKYNSLLKNKVQNMTIKEMREDLAADGVTELPSKKAELIDLYIKTFQE